MQANLARPPPLVRSDPNNRSCRGWTAGPEPSPGRPPQRIEEALPRKARHQARQGTPAPILAFAGSMSAAFLILMLLTPAQASTLGPETSPQVKDGAGKDSDPGFPLLLSVDLAHPLTAFPSPAHLRPRIPRPAPAPQFRSLPCHGSHQPKL